MLVIKSQREIDIMRQSGRIAATAMEEALNAVKPGITTESIDRLVENVITKHGATPSFKGYNGFPGSICISVNEEVVHGIPGKRRLLDGDIVSIDLGAFYNGYHSDMARTIPVGNVEEDILRLVEVTKESFFRGMDAALIGNRINDISRAVQTYAESKGMSVVRELVGHGVGQKLHEEPSIPNFVSRNRGPKLSAGMTLAIEPMINMGVANVCFSRDGWTVTTADQKPSAHYENTVAVTEDGPLILTAV